MDSTRGQPSRRGLFFAAVVVVGAVLLYVLGTVFEISGFLHRTTVMATPLLLGTLGEIYAERSGVLNLGVEGIMATGAILAVISTFATGSPWVGVLGAMAGGALLGLLFAVVVIPLRGMQVPAGLGLFMFGLGFSGMIGAGYVGRSLPTHFRPLPIPLLQDIPVAGPLLFSHDILVYVSLVLVPLLWFFLFKTTPGLVLRSVGEDPGAADAAGVDVHAVQYAATVFGGSLAGLAGAYLTLAWTPSWTEGMSSGRGWIVIALTIFALWDPAKALFGAWLFGGMFALTFGLQGMGMPVRLLGMLPFLVTLLVLGLVLAFTEQMGAPSALLEHYERE